MDADALIDALAALGLGALVFLVLLAAVLWLRSGGDG